MSVVIRYFAVTGAGAADGTSHANRAALFSAGNWSTVITGFNFAGTDSMEARVEAGSYTCSQTMASGLFTNAPTAVNPLVLVGADSSGNILALPNPAWKSCQPAWDTSTMPTIATTTNIRTFNLTTVNMHMLNLTASGSTSGPLINAAGTVDWCQATISSAGASVSAAAQSGSHNCVFKCTGTQYSTVNSGASQYNCRLEGNLSASSGTRTGVSNSGAATTMIGCTIINNPGGGIANTGTAVNSTLAMNNCVIAANGADGVLANSPAAQTAFWQAYNSMITGNTGWGINGNTNSHWSINQVRLRNNSSGDITGVGSSPIDVNVVTTAGSDAAEYVDVASGDFRIKNTSTYWGQGLGVADQPAAASGGAGFFIQ